jgi:hypothetical protein
MSTKHLPDLIRRKAVLTGPVRPYGPMARRDIRQARRAAERA